MKSKKEIKDWMDNNLSLHIDKLTGDLNCTSLVESWDSNQSTGVETLDNHHIAWDIAIDIQWQRRDGQR